VTNHKFFDYVKYADIVDIDSMCKCRHFWFHWVL